MSKKFVLYGEANQGKSTIIGHIISTACNLDLDKYENHFYRKFGRNYHEDLLYSWMINRDTFISEKGINDLTGEHKTVSKFNAFAKTITTAYRSIKFKLADDEIEFCLIDTPGSDRYRNMRDKGLQGADVGIFCVEIGEVLKDSFNETYVEKQDVWPVFWHVNHGSQMFPIVVLTKMDLHPYKEAYDEACRKFQEFSGYNNINTAIIPVTVNVARRSSMNVFPDTRRFDWYGGPTLLDKIGEICKKDKL